MKNNSVLGTIYFRSGVTTHDYALMSEYGNYKVTDVSYQQFCTNPPIDCYTFKIADKE